MAEDEPRSDGGTGLSVDADERAEPEDAPERSLDDGDDANTDASSLEGTDLVVGYPATEQPVIDGETLCVPPGAVTALVGPNGSGKSTLLKGMADQLALDSGTVLLDGRDVRSMGTKELARNLGLLSQERTSPESITVEMLVEHGRYPHRGPFDGLSGEDRAAIDRAIDLAGIDHLRERDVGSLSGGQRQLAWIAMALAQDTDVLLLDEPTTFLDLHHQLEVMAIVERLRDESDVTVVLVLHDIEQAARHADHVVALRDGEIYARGPPEAVVSEELLAEVFAIDAEVERTERGPRVVPLRPRHDGEGAEDEVTGDGR